MSAPYGIIGWPLGHTKSPLLHNWGLRASGLPGSYAAWPTEPKKLKAFMAEVRARRIKGVSVTIPHKQAVMPFLDGLTERARTVGAVNTLFWRDGKLLGDNTDVAGIVAPLTPYRAALTAASATALGLACCSSANSSRSNTGTARGTTASVAAASSQDDGTAGAIQSPPVVTGGAAKEGKPVSEGMNGSASLLTSE